MYKRTSLWLALLAVVVTLWAVSPLRPQSNGNSNSQIILSGTALPATPNPPCTPWGMWVWSQPGNNNYGNDGDGSLYFYGIHGGEAHVSASDVTLSGSSVSETVSGAYPDGTGVTCSLAAHQTSPGKGILDSMSCTVGASSCAATDIPITVGISNAKN